MRPRLLLGDMQSTLAAIAESQREVEEAKKELSSVVVEPGPPAPGPADMEIDELLGHIGVELTADQQAALKEKIAESKKRKLGPPPSLPASQGDLEAVGNPPARRHGRPGGAGCQLRRERQGCAKAEKPLAQEYTCAARWQARRWSLGCRPGGFTQSWRVGFFLSGPLRTQRFDFFSEESCFEACLGDAFAGTSTAGLVGSDGRQLEYRQALRP